MLVEREDEMRSMIGRLEKYEDGKGLEINTEKTKIIRFKKGRWENKKDGMEMEKRS